MLLPYDPDTSRAAIMMQSLSLSSLLAAAADETKSRSKHGHGDVDEEEEDKEQHMMPDIIYRRALHVVTEDDRVLRCVEALKAGDWKEVGKLMTESHVSLSRDYEVSCDELDAIVEIANEMNPSISGDDGEAGDGGVVGARMTGGGFGGSAIALVRSDRAKTLQLHLEREYKKRVGRDCTCFVALPSAGAGPIDLYSVMSAPSWSPSSSSSSGGGLRREGVPAGVAKEDEGVAWFSLLMSGLAIGVGIGAALVTIKWQDNMFGK